ncbi:MAG: hypothetical protein GY881_15005 [Gammaproteobacteria bacterium]|nr:hypothetical protein [Gammaproteobacteria bacterium]
MEDDEADEVYAEKASDFGDDGIAQFPALAERMAKYGRNEDNMLAHVAEGELVIPAQFLEDEVIKQRIYDILTEAGVEDPEAYVVGAEANDLNPTTGLPEFFLKKFFKKVVKGIKKVVKGVVKVIKKIAPIVLPIALAMVPVLGPMYGAALGSGIGTLIQGGSIKDALKSALISGAIGGVTAGFKGPGSFGQNIADAASNPLGRLSTFGGQVVEGATSGSVGGFFDSVYAAASPTGELLNATNPNVNPNQVDPNANPTSGNTAVDAQAGNPPAGSNPNPPAGSNPNPPPTPDATAATEPPGFFESVKGALDPTDDVGFFDGMKDAFMPGTAPVNETAVNNAAYTEAYNNAMQLPGMTPELAAQQAMQAGTNAVASATANAAPNLLRRFGPTALAGTAVAGGMGFFDVPEMEQANFLDYNPDGSPVTGADLIAADPGKYLVHDLGQQQLNLETGEYETVGQDTTTEELEEAAYLPPAMQPVMQNNAPVNQAGYLMASNPGGPFVRPYVTAAEGGPIFPRRTGGIAPTEGTPGEDSVRAMLMPGEFVMTTDAVRGLGNGNLNSGIKNMYTVMRNLESRGRAMA